MREYVWTCDFLRLLTSFQFISTHICGHSSVDDDDDKDYNHYYPIRILISNQGPAE